MESNQGSLPKFVLFHGYRPKRKISYVGFIVLFFQNRLTLIFCSI